VFNTPPPPRAVSARLDATGTNAIVTWMSGGGPVTQYEVLIYTENGIETNTVSASTFAYTDSGYDDDPAAPFDEPYFQVVAHYSNGSTLASDVASVSLSSFNLDVQFLRGASGALYLAVASAPANLSKIRVFQEPGFSHFDIYATNLVNGVTPLPMNQFVEQPSALDYQCYSTNGNFGSALFSFVAYSDGIGNPAWPRTNFVNAAAHLKENLRFLLRSGMFQGWELMAVTTYCRQLISGMPEICSRDRQAQPITSTLAITCSTSTATTP
jgi:hypothetical protein